MLSDMDERRRSVVKGISWRVFATADTVLLALIFTGNANAAFSIGGLELLTKTLWYYAHERAWLHFDTRAVSRMSGLFGENAHARSIAKAVTWRFVGALDTFLIALLITGRFAISGAIGSTELLTKIPLYYLHERLWVHVHWGKREDAVAARFAHFPEHVRDALELLRGYYHLGVALFYGLLCFVSVVLGAALVYAAHFFIRAG